MKGLNLIQAIQDSGSTGPVDLRAKAAQRLANGRRLRWRQERGEVLGKLDGVDELRTGALISGRLRQIHQQHIEQSFRAFLGPKIFRDALQARERA